MNPYLRTGIVFKPAFQVLPRPVAYPQANPNPEVRP
jgi:hypothetical protein